MTPAPPAPPEAAAVFGQRLPLMCRYAERLATDGVTRGLLGPREADRVWDRHLLNSAVLLDLLPPGTDVLDLGSGAGLPGLVVALARPDLRVQLVEPQLRRARFLRECRDDLGVPVEVVHARAQDLTACRQADTVVARAVRPLASLVPLAMPLLTPGGRLLAIKGDRVEEELMAADGVLRAWAATAVVHDRRRSATPGRVVEIIPRRAGVARTPAAAQVARV